MDTLILNLLMPLAQAVPAVESDAMLHNGLRLTQEIAVYLGSALGLYLCFLFAGRIAKRYFHLPLTWVYHLFCIFVALYLPTTLAFIRIPGQDHLEAALTLSAAFVLVGLVRHYFFDLLLHKGEKAQVPKFLSEFVSIAIIVTALLLILQFIYGKEVPGLLAGAGIAGIVLGLALQDTLGNIFSGFAIYFGGQFKAGDWLLVEGHHAQIMEINWRSTRLRTGDEVCLDIPNSSITKQTVVNFTYPTPIHATKFSIGLDYNVAPSLVKTVLIEAALDCPLVLRTPVPDTFMIDFANSSITYELRFWIDDHANGKLAASQIRSNLWYALRRHNISIPYPIQNTILLKPPKPEQENRALIQHSIQKAMFAPALSDEQLEEIVKDARMVDFGAGENIIRQDAVAGPMYILVRGHAEVWIETDGRRTAMATLGPDACIGENSILTGEKRTATILAAEDCLAVEVRKETLAPILSACPELLDTLSELLAQRCMQNEGVFAEANSANMQSTKSTYKAGFLGKIRSFFQL